MGKTIRPPLSRRLGAALTIVGVVGEPDPGRARRGAAGHPVLPGHPVGRRSATRWWSAADRTGVGPDVRKSIRDAAPVPGRRPGPVAGRGAASRHPRCSSAATRCSCWASSPRRAPAGLRRHLRGGLLRRGPAYPGVRDPHGDGGDPPGHRPARPPRERRADRGREPLPASPERWPWPRSSGVCSSAWPAPIPRCWRGLRWSWEPWQWSARCCRRSARPGSIRQWRSALSEQRGVGKKDGRARLCLRYTDQAGHAHPGLPQLPSPAGPGAVGSRPVAKPLSILSLGVGAIFLIVPGQSIELLQALVEGGHGGHRGRYLVVVFALASAAWAVTTWYSARLLLSFRFDGEVISLRAELPLTRSLAEWLPRVLGSLTYLVTAIALVDAFAVHRGAPDARWGRRSPAAARRSLAGDGRPLLSGGRRAPTDAGPGAPEGPTHRAASGAKGDVRGALHGARRHPSVRRFGPHLADAFIIAPAAALVALGIGFAASPVRLRAAVRHPLHPDPRPLGVDAAGHGHRLWSHRTGVPISLALLALLLVSSLWNDNHALRRAGPPAARSTFARHLRCWRDPAGSGNPLRGPVILVAAEGGGIRAACYTAAVLARFQDLSPRLLPAPLRHQLGVRRKPGSSDLCLADRPGACRRPPRRARKGSAARARPRLPRPDGCHAALPGLPAALPPGALPGSGPGARNGALLGARVPARRAIGSLRRSGLESAVADRRELHRPLAPPQRDLGRAREAFSHQPDLSRRRRPLRGRGRRADLDPGRRPAEHGGTPQRPLPVRQPAGRHRRIRTRRGRRLLRELRGGNAARGGERPRHGNR